MPAAVAYQSGSRWGAAEIAVIRPAAKAGWSAARAASRLLTTRQAC